jgi:hypothetical protein
MRRVVFSTYFWQEFLGWYFWNTDGEKCGPFLCRQLAMENYLGQLKLRVSR